MQAAPGSPRNPPASGPGSNQRASPGAPGVFLLFLLFQAASAVNSLPSTQESTSRGCLDLLQGDSHAGLTTPVHARRRTATSCC